MLPKIKVLQQYYVRIAYVILLQHFYFRCVFSLFYFCCNTCIFGNISYASRNLLTSGGPRVNNDVVVMWCIPPPNSSPSFEVSAIFSP